MDPGLVIWKGNWSENLIGCECGASDGVLLGNGPWLGDMEGYRFRKIRLGVNVGHQMEFSWEIDNWTPTQECGRDFGW